LFPAEPMPSRWDHDERGHGVGDATQLVPGASELVAAFSQSDWVAEQPEVHLDPLPKPRLTSASAARMVVVRRRNCASRSARESWFPRPGSHHTATSWSLTWPECSSQTASQECRRASAELRTGRTLSPTRFRTRSADRGSVSNDADVACSGLQPVERFVHIGWGRLRRPTLTDLSDLS
jgi:hypothetical protein